MAHLKCSHERRVVVVRDREENAVIRHRSDGGFCDARYVAIGNVVYDPTAHGTAATVGTSQDKMFGPLGPVITLASDLSEVAARIVKTKRQVRKHKKLIVK